MASCIVLDRSGDRVLIQHADLDTNEYSLEIRDGRASRFYRLPERIMRLAPGGYTGRLIHGVQDAILIDGLRVQMEVVPD